MLIFIVMLFSFLFISLINFFFFFPKKELRAALAEMGQTHKAPLTGWESMGDGQVQPG